MQHTSTPIEVAELKKKLVASLSLKPLLENYKDRLKAFIHGQKTFKNFWMQEKLGKMIDT